MTKSFSGKIALVTGASHNARPGKVESGFPSGRAAQKEKP